MASGESLGASFVAAMFVLGVFVGYFGTFFFPGWAFLPLPPATVIAAAVVVIYVLDRSRGTAGPRRRD